MNPLRLAVLATVFLFPCAGAVASDPPATPPAPSKPAPSTPAPSFANVTCPIMGKPASHALFVETAYGRIYACCAPCYPRIRKDLEHAYRAAYPVARTADNTRCPITAKPVPEDAPTVELQGVVIRLCCSSCTEPARAEPLVVLVKATNPRARDVGNTICPVTGRPVRPNLFCLVGDDIVRVESPECVALVEADPQAALAKAKESAQKPPASSDPAPTTNERPESP